MGAEIIVELTGRVLAWHAADPGSIPWHHIWSPPTNLRRVIPDCSLK